MTRKSRRSIRNAVESLGTPSSTDPSDAEIERIRDVWRREIRVIGGPEVLSEVTADVFERHGVEAALTVTDDGLPMTEFNGVGDLQDPHGLDRDIEPEEFVGSLAEDVHSAVLGAAGECSLEHYVGETPADTPELEDVQQAVWDCFRNERERRLEQDHPEPWHSGGSGA